MFIKKEYQEVPAWAGKERRILMSENQVKLTKLAKCAGCGAKVGAGVLSQLLDGIRVHQDPKLLVGFDKSDNASV